jgi:hypothetical protein
VRRITPASWAEQPPVGVQDRQSAHGDVRELEQPLSKGDGPHFVESLPPDHRDVPAVGAERLGERLVLWTKNACSCLLRPSRMRSCSPRHPRLSRQDRRGRVRRRRRGMCLFSLYDRRVAPMPGSIERSRRQSARTGTRWQQWNPSFSRCPVAVARPLMRKHLGRKGCLLWAQPSGGTGMAVVLRAVTVAPGTAPPWVLPLVSWGVCCRAAVCQVPGSVDTGNCRSAGR